MSEEVPIEEVPVEEPITVLESIVFLTPSVFRFVDPGVIAIVEILVPPPNINPSG